MAVLVCIRYAPALAYILLLYAAYLPGDWVLAVCGPLKAEQTVDIVVVREMCWVG